MLWIKEVEIVDSLEEFKSSRSIEGKDFPDFEMLDAKIASVLTRSSRIPNSRSQGQSRGTEKPRKRTGSTRKTDRLHHL